MQSPSLNGHAPKQTPKVKTKGYRIGIGGGMPYWPRLTTHRGIFRLQLVDEMLTDPQNRFADGMLCAPVHIAEPKAESPYPDVQEWVQRQFDKIWETELDKALGFVAYGSSGGEAVWDGDELDSLRDVHMLHRRPVEEDGKLIGVNVYNVPGEDRVELREPGEWWWLINRPRYCNFWGVSNGAGAYFPWIEKFGYKGGWDIRRKWYFKHAYTGGIIRYPGGTIEDNSGKEVSCKDVAREIMEKMETGGDLSLPGGRDAESKEYKWTVEWAKVSGSLDDVREYIKDMDREILIGWQIPDEVVKASEGAGGYASRAVPALLYWVGEDRFVKTTIHGLDLQVVRPRAKKKFGERAIYTVKAESLVPKTPDQIQQEQAEQQQQGQPGEQPGAGQQQPAQDQPAAQPAEHATGYGKRGGRYYTDASGYKRYMHGDSSADQRHVGTKKVGSQFGGIGLSEDEECDLATIICGGQATLDDIRGLPKALDRMDDDEAADLAMAVRQCETPEIVPALLALMRETIVPPMPMMTAPPVMMSLPQPVAQPIPQPQPVIVNNHQSHQGEMERLMGALDMALEQFSQRDEEIKVPVKVNFPSYTIERDPETGLLARVVPDAPEPVVLSEPTPYDEVLVMEELVKLKQEVANRSLTIPVNITVQPQAY